MESFDEHRSIVNLSSIPESQNESYMSIDSQRAKQDRRNMMASVVLNFEDQPNSIEIVLRKDSINVGIDDALYKSQSFRQSGNSMSFNNSSILKSSQESSFQAHKAVEQVHKISLEEPCLQKRYIRP